MRFSPILPEYGEKATKQLKSFAVDVQMFYVSVSCWLLALKKKKNH